MMSTTLNLEKMTGPPLVDADWYGFAQALYKGYRQEKIGKKCMTFYKSKE